jgi:hypothetical protein
MALSKKSFKNFFKNKFLLTVLITGFIFNLAGWLAFYFGLDLNKNSLILHYNSFFGIDRIFVNAEEKKIWEIFFAPLGGFFVLVFNYFLGIILVFGGWDKSNQQYDLKNLPTSILGGYFILFSAIILQIVILMYTIAIVLVNR